MDYEWDEHKRIANQRRHKVDFATVEKFNWETAILIEDDRRDYGEIRYRAMGLIGIRVHALVFTMRDSIVRVISLRKATRREVKNYDKSLRY